MHESATEAERAGEVGAEPHVCPECHTRHIFTRKGQSWSLFCGCEQESPGIEPARYNGEYDGENEPDN
jgi:hypothetical protein